MRRSLWVHVEFGHTLSAQVSRLTCVILKSFESSITSNHATSAYIVCIVFPSHQRIVMGFGLLLLFRDG